MLFRKLMGIPKSFFSKNFYQEVGQVWKGTGISYLLLVTLVFALPLIHVSYSMALKLTHNLKNIAAQFPVITLQDGRANIDQPSPFSVIDPVTQKQIAIFDTNTTEDMSDTKDILFFLNKDKVVINLPNMTTPTIYDLSKAKDFVYDQTAITNIVNKIKNLLIALFCLIAFLFYFVPSAFITFFYAALMKVIAKTRLSYKVLCRLAAVALTPTLFLAAVLRLVNQTLPYQSIVYVLLSLGYLFFAIEVNKNIRKPIEE